MRSVVSVIIPVYNAGENLQPCLDSIRDQTWPDLEVWMVDDGSTDGSGSVCDAYAASDPRFHVIHQKNAGASAARNVGIERATGRYVSFIDSDDWIETDFYETLTGLFDRELSDEETAMGMCCYCLSDGKPCLPLGKTDEAVLRGDEALSFIIADKMSGPCNKLFLLSGIREKNLRFDPGLTVGEDMLFVFEYLQGGAVKYIPYGGYHYRQTAGSVSRSDFKPSRMSIFDALDRIGQEGPPAIRGTVSSKRAYTAMVSMLFLMTSERKPENEKEIRKRLKQIMRSNLKEMIKAPEYSAAEKCAAVMVAASPGLGTALYRAVYMNRIENR